MRRLGVRGIGGGRKSVTTVTVKDKKADWISWNASLPLERRTVCIWPTSVVPGFLRTLVFVRPCGGDQCAAGTFSPSLDMSR